MNPPVKDGERVVVHGRPERAIVVGSQYLNIEARWLIKLDWGDHFRSHVYDTDEGKVWYRYAQTN
jgi:hypothetical protein